MRAAGVPARARRRRRRRRALGVRARVRVRRGTEEPRARAVAREAVARETVAAKRSPAKQSPAKQSPAKPSVAARPPPARRARAGLSTTAAPLVTNSRHGNVYGATATATSPRRVSRDRKLANETNRENRSPSPRASPTKEKATRQQLAEAPAWGTSPSKGKFRDDRAADAVAEARRRRRREACTSALVLIQEIQN